MSLRGLRSSTETTPYQEKESMLGIDVEEVNTPGNVSGDPSVASHHDAMYEIENIPDRSRSRDPESLLNYTRVSENMPNAIDSIEPTRTNSQDVCSLPNEGRKSRNRPFKSVTRASRKSSKDPTGRSKSVSVRDSKKKSRSSRKNQSEGKSATATPRTKSGAMIVNERVGQSNTSIPGLGRTMNGRVFGVVFFMGNSQAPAEQSKKVKQDKQVVHKEVRKKQKQAAKGKERKVSEKKVEDRKKSEKKKRKRRGILG